MPDPAPPTDITIEEVLQVAKKTDRTDAQAVEDEAQDSPLAHGTERGYIGEVPDKTPNAEYAAGGAIATGQKLDPSQEARVAEVQEESLTTEAPAPASNWDKDNA